MRKEKIWTCHILFFWFWVLVTPTMAVRDALSRALLYVSKHPDDVSFANGVGSKIASLILRDASLVSDGFFLNQTLGDSRVEGEIVYPFILRMFLRGSAEVVQVVHAQSNKTILEVSRETGSRHSSVFWKAYYMAS